MESPDTSSTPTTEAAQEPKAGISRRSLIIGGGIVGAAAIAGIAFGVSRGGAAASGKAAVIVKNGVVWTGDPQKFAEALAIDAKGTIIGVGTLAEMKAFNGPNTEVIDAAGGTVMPGIHDGHAHVFTGAEAAFYPSDGNAVGTIDEQVARVQAILDADTEAGKDDWLVVVDWNPTGLTDGVAHRKYLDALDTGRPILMRGSDAHNGWVNTRALEVAKITADTPNPDGGEIVKDQDGPTGLLKDSAMWAIGAVIPDITEKQKLKLYKQGFGLMTGLGITSFMQPGAGTDDIAKFVNLSDTGVIPQRARVALAIGSDEQFADPKATIAEFNTFRTAVKDHPMVSTGTVKIFMDGVAEYPAQTAAMLTPYLDANGAPTDNSGELYVAADTFGSITTALDAEGWQVHTHSIGDLAARTCLDGYELAQKTNGKAVNRHTIAHMQFCSPEDFPRFAKNKVIANLSNQWAVQDTFTIDAMEPFMGPERHKFMYPTGSLLQASAAIAGGSDWPVDQLSPWNQIRTAVDRIGLGSETGEPLHAEQGISLNDSLTMHTKGAAFQMFQEDVTGSIEVGKQADIVILDRNLFGVPIAEVTGSTVNYTLINGEVVHDISTAEGSKYVNTASAAAAAVSSRVLSAGKSKGGCCGPVLSA
ncbi:amidohydrolase [Leifsonia sp. YAF41]|uniref:amidohydrolase n=1 Tax=Leifsonia sp. YAF41 TaxID=3233086 RepID=UPI003F9585C7